MFGFLRRLVSKSGKSDSLESEGGRRQEASSTIAITYDEKAVHLLFEGQIKQEVAWREIDLIAICIEDEFLPLPYWYVGNKDNLLRIPNDASGGKELFFDGFCERISGYKSDATFKTIIEASAAMEGSFIVWRAQDASAS